MDNSSQLDSSGGHFDKKIFGDEIMVPNDPLDARFSQMTLAVAADSGWYDINLSLIHI